jgi:uncharacterized protein
MQYAQYGKNGPMVSRLGFGVMRLIPRKKGEWGSVNFSKSVPIIRAALDRGVNFLDTHFNYHHGLSEVAIGKALKGWKGHRVYIQTKAPMYQGKSLAHYKRCLQESLEKCGVDTIDYLFSHAMAMDAHKKHNAKFLKLTDWALGKGYIRHRGFSSHDTASHIQKYIKTGYYDAMLVSLNWRTRDMADTIALAADKGMGVAVMNPVGGGMLSETTPMITRLLPGAKTSAEVGLRYVLSTPGVTLALSGMNTVEQVAENTATAGRKSWMTPKQRTRFLGKLAKLEKKAAARCTACGYCMPCPSGVAIPAIFLLMNQAKFFGQEETARNRYMSYKSQKADISAAACVRCGKCLPKCPNGVPIIECLAEAEAHFTS